MKITQVRLGRISTPLRVPFKTALRTVNSVEDVIVELHTDTGAVGYGEAPPTGVITGDTADAIMKYMTSIEAAKQITDDIGARYKAFADAEALLINNALVIPRGMSVPAYLATRLNYWEGQYASTGFSNKRLKGIHVLDHYVSMEEYEANRDAR